MSSEPLHRWSAVRLLRALATRELTAAALAEALIERSAAHEPRLHAWVGWDVQAVRGRARALDLAARAGSLRGLPIAVKDNIDTAGLPTAYGSPIYAGHVPALDAACVALARAESAWVLGKMLAWLLEKVLGTDLPGCFLENLLLWLAGALAAWFDEPAGNAAN